MGFLSIMIKTVFESILPDKPGYIIGNLIDYLNIANKK